MAALKAWEDASRTLTEATQLANRLARDLVSVARGQGGMLDPELLQGYDDAARVELEASALQRKRRDEYNEAKRVHEAARPR